MRTLLRILTTALALVVPVTAAAAITHRCLDGTYWTDPTPHQPKPTLAAPVTVEPAPTTTVVPAPAGTPGPWPLGSCLTKQMQPTTCVPGALRIVGTVQDPGDRPCNDLPGTLTRRTGDYALCLITR